ncbi:hypothetical protein CASFOL_042126 [Castilleja foliolosa]|uniref:DUF4408 domain-containing protein n=1 Tax=Castilleja foliolosa TaxID=1961234 RepID=A0ABD3B9N2_9LAMI
MDSLKFRDIKVEKPNTNSKHRSITKLSTLFRFLELFVFVIIVSQFSTQFSFSFNRNGEYFRGISVTLISPRFVFLVGNAIVVVLLLISGQFSTEKGRKSVDFYDEYVEKSQNKSQHKFSRVGYYEAKTTTKKKTMSRCKSENYMERVSVKDLRRSVSEKCRKREEEMSGEEFRRTVEAFIARQKSFLKEEE